MKELKIITILFSILILGSSANAGPLMEADITVKNVSDDSTNFAGTVNWSGVNLGVTEWKAADQYLYVTYACIQEQGDIANPNDDVWYDGWVLHIYTDNMSNAANPKYTGVYPQEYSAWGKAGAPAGDFAAGLICKDSTANRLPVCWRASWDEPFKDDPATQGKNEKLENLNIIEDSEDHCLRRKPKAEEDYRCWIWMKDKSNDGWSAPIVWEGKYYQNPDLKWEYGMLYATVVCPNGVQHAEYSFDGWGVGPVKIQPNDGKYGVYIYLGARFNNALAQTQYKTNTITVEVYHL